MPSYKGAYIYEQKYGNFSEQMQNYLNKSMQLSRGKDKKAATLCYQTNAQRAKSFSVPGKACDQLASQPGNAGLMLGYFPTRKSHLNKSKISPDTN